jgi:hypothetical protein
MIEARRALEVLSPIPAPTRILMTSAWPYEER